MSEEILATEIGLARDEILSQSEFESRIISGSKRRIKKVYSIEEPQVTSISVAIVTEAPKDSWDDFSPVMQRLIGHFERMEASYMVPVEMQNQIRLTTNATRIEEFNHLTDEQLSDLKSMIRHDLPRIREQIEEFVQCTSVIRILPVDVDFI